MRLIKRFGISNKGFERIAQVLEGGLAEEEGTTEKDVIPKELAMGIEVEKEHTNDEELAKEIALDHLTEIPDYYTRLKEMEAEALGKVEDEEDED